MKKGKITHFQTLVTTLLRISGLVMAALAFIGILTGHWGHVITLLLGVSLVLFEE